MKYARIKRDVLELINRYSVAGEVISPAYNNQSDDLHRIPAFVNHALRDIRPDTDTLPDDPSDTYDLSVPEETVQAACYYAASTLVLWEDPELSGRLREEYLRRLERLPKRLETGGTIDVWFAPD